MNLNLALDLFLYGLAAAILTVVADYLKADEGFIWGLPGVGGGILCAIYGFRACRGKGRVFRSILIIQLLTLYFGIQALVSWSNALIREGDESIAIVFTIGTVLSIGQLTNLIPARRERSKERAADATSGERDFTKVDTDQPK